MHPFCEELIDYIQKEDKERAFNYLMDKIKNQKIGVLEMYTEILAPTLNQIIYRYDTKNLRIWEEHVYTGIILTVLENCYPYVLKERDKRFKEKEKLDKSVMVICPSKEYHILGARMATDFFTIAGYTATYVGNDTPRSVIVESIKEKHPDYIAISVTNPYHLVSTKRVINEIRENIPEDVKIILGGRAASDKQKVKNDLGVDYVLNSFEDIVGLRAEILKDKKNTEEGRK